MLALIHSCVSIFRQSCSGPDAPVESTFSTFFWSLGAGFFLLVAIAATPMLIVYSSSKRKKKIPVMRSIQVTGKSPVPFEDYDSEYSFELQLQEVLLGSDSPDMSYTSSVIQERILSSTEHIEIENIQTESFCEICLEDKESWQMFRNNSCSHSFCYECTSKHIEARIQENLKTIKCPGANCRATLSFDVCRSMIPKDVLSRWELFLCMSSVPDAQKLFCPFRTCSAMLIHDTGEVIREIECPACHRLFCAQCQVPWHPDFTCKEFQKINSKKGKKDELMFKLLAKKKNWQKCPSCKMHVEKTEGCIHITCRCGYQFCYRCGSKWSGSHSCGKA